MLFETYIWTVAKKYFHLGRTAEGTTVEGWSQNRHTNPQYIVLAASAVQIYQRDDLTRFSSFGFH